MAVAKVTAALLSVVAAVEVVPPNKLFVNIVAVSPKQIKKPQVKVETRQEPVKSTEPIEVDLTKPRHIDLLEIPDRDTRRLSADERLSRGITQ